MPLKKIFTLDLDFGFYLLLVVLLTFLPISFCFTFNQQKLPALFELSERYLFAFNNAFPLMLIFSHASTPLPFLRALYLFIYQVSGMHLLCTSAMMSLNISHKDPKLHSWPPKRYRTDSAFCHSGHLFILLETEGIQVSF